MKFVTVITLLGNKEIINRIYQNAEPLIEQCLKKKYPYNGTGLLNIPIYDNKFLFDYIVKTANDYKIDLRFFQDTYYNKKEIEKALFFQMKVPLITELEGTTAKDYGTKFWGGCNVCGIDAKLNSDLMIDKKLLKKYDIGNANPCIFVSERLKKIILDNNFSGVSFKYRVKDFKGRHISNFYVLNIENTLPKMNISTWLKKGIVESCGHNTIYLQSDIKYSKHILNYTKDFNLSHEYIDNFKLQQVIVSAKVRDIFKKNRVHAGFTPIYIGDCCNDFMPSTDSINSHFNIKN